MSSDLIFGVLGVPECHSRLFQTHLSADLHRRNWGGQVAQAHQVVGGAGKGEDRQELLGHVASSNRSRFLVKTVGSHTSSSAFSPTNQRNSSSGWSFRTRSSGDKITEDVILLLVGSAHAFSYHTRLCTGNSFCAAC